MEVFVGQDEGRWPKGTRVRKVNTRPGDTHQDGALGTIVGALGPVTASQRAEAIIDLAKNGINGDVEYIYWVEWDDIPGIPVAVADDRIEPVANENQLFLEHRQGESGLRVRGHFIPFMKEGQELDVILCVPKGLNPLEEAGVIVPGSQTGKCDTCGQDIWLAPSTQELMRAYPLVPTRCVDCVARQLETEDRE